MRKAFTAGLLAAASACTTVAMPDPPPPIPEPSVRVAEHSFVDDGPLIERPEVDVPRDPILHSRFRGVSTMDDEIERWARYWALEHPEWFTQYLSRMSAYEHIVDEELTRHELPASLRYLPIIESGYLPDAVSHASAVGLWQLGGPTARQAGLQVGRLVDERRDPVTATRVALIFLRDLHERFESWFLALAAYNGGPNRVRRLLDEHASGHPLSDSLYFVIRPYLPRETREYVPRFLAATVLASNPARFSIPEGEPRDPFVFDEVAVPDATSLDVVARAAGVSEEQVVALNRHVLRGVTAKGVTTVLRVPFGSGPRFDAEYARIPPDERVTVTEHVVVPGDTMWDIARAYGIPLDTLLEANPRVEPERIRPGDRLLVPLLSAGSALPGS